MTKGRTRQDWEELAAREAKGKDLSRATPEGITLKTVYGPAGLEQVFRVLNQHTGDATRRDDLTLVLLRS